MRRLIALALSAVLIAPGCATVTGGAQTTTASRYQAGPQGVHALPDRAALSDFARQLPAGARVRVKLTSGDTIRGTLIKTTDTSLVVQPRTRIAEPLIDVPFDRLAALEQETPGSSTGRAIAIGAAAGAGAALGVIMLLIAIAGD
ncbi:MAG TPA: hypothetical protein VFJ02_01040 [Vicinamibacterales bacterium]|nr:hypothetical protein [Vicinamibacterales bacterium]